MERFRSISFADTALFAIFDVLPQQSLRKKFRPLSTKKKETVQSLKNDACKRPRAELVVDENGYGAVVPKKRQILEKKLVFDGEWVLFVSRDDCKDYQYKSD